MLKFGLKESLRGPQHNLTSKPILSLPKQSMILNIVKILIHKQAAFFYILIEHQTVSSCQAI